MGRQLIIIGGLEGDSTPDRLISLIPSTTGESVIWVRAVAPAYNIVKEDEHQYKRLLHQLREQHARTKRYPGQEHTPTGLPDKGIQKDYVLIVKLHLLNNRVQNEIFRVCPQAIQAPKYIKTVDGLVQWVLSPQANIYPRREWCGNLSEYALVCVLEKLVSNKSWNKDQHGHAWTKEADLLSQAPVSTSSHPEVRSEAQRLLHMADGTLFLTKGGSQTPKEWCISTVYCVAVKKAITDLSFEPLKECPNLVALFNRMDKDPRNTYSLHEVISERVKHICNQTA